MNDKQLLRYSRQIMLPAFDIEGQQRLLSATVLIVGLGGLGSPVSMYLAAAGVGHLILVDDDLVDLSNLQRQIVHTEQAVGVSKVESAAATLSALNHDIRITGMQQRLDESSLAELLAGGVDLVVDACDNFNTRFVINQACVNAGVPLVSGAAIRLEGQVAVFDSRRAHSPCYQCLYRAGDDEQTGHIARREFRLNGRAQSLLMLRQLTTELRRQEVQTWKKVIRVISHELNNSLAPVASLAHSGAELTRRGQTERLESIFATIEERARHLEGFISGYAHFAKLPSPRLEVMHWPAFVAGLRSQIGFTVLDELPEEPARLDVPQVEQALLNLLKNAHESGSKAEDIGLRVRRQSGLLRLEVSDRGSGMSEAVLANALVPFYSTKRSGTGLGLALAREIAEAHGGRIGLANREGGGLVVAMVIPDA